MLELDDIQSGVLRPRPAPYAATYVLFRIDDRQGGAGIDPPHTPVGGIGCAPGEPGGRHVGKRRPQFSGPQSIGCAASISRQFLSEFQQGMAARARILGDTGESSPEHWEKPLGSADVHVVLTALAPDTERLEAALARARQEYQKISGITAIWSQNCHALPNEREAFGFKDGISHPAIEGSGIPGTNPNEQPLKPGEFVLGYPDEIGDGPAIPKPDVLGRNGSTWSFANCTNGSPRSVSI